MDVNWSEPALDLFHRELILNALQPFAENHIGPRQALPIEFRMKALLQDLNTLRDHSL